MLASALRQAYDALVILHRPRMPEGESGGRPAYSIDFLFTLGGTEPSGGRKGFPARALGWACDFYLLVHLIEAQTLNVLVFEGANETKRCSNNSLVLNHN